MLNAHVYLGRSRRRVTTGGQAFSLQSSFGSNGLRTRKAPGYASTQSREAALGPADKSALLGAHLRGLCPA